MRNKSTKKSKFSWSKTLIKKWFNTKSTGRDFGANDNVFKGTNQEWSNNFTERGATTTNKSEQAHYHIHKRTSRRNSDADRRSKLDLEASQLTDLHNYRIFTATWNVAGISPPSNLNIEDWLHASPPADIYVFGFQEVVPLNAGNVLGTEDNVPARKWLALVQKTLNNLPSSTNSCHTPTISNPVIELVSDFEVSITQKASSLFSRHSFQYLGRSKRTTEKDISLSLPQLKRGFSVRDQDMSMQRMSDYGSDFKLFSSVDQNEDYSLGADENTSMFSNRPFQGKSRYCLVSSKQMVGIFLTIWVKRDLRKHVNNMKVSCVERGLLGYFGNKGSISISMSLHQTSFCFVCSHLTSGQKEGDELRRNLDVMEILNKTRFSKVHGTRDYNSPRTILEHDRVIWLGDLNYRIALSQSYAKAFVEMCNWRALLENDQLKIEQRQGRVFKGWHEGKIRFPPTYKYLNNSDTYAGDDSIPKEKRRTPAWCDRILWYGKGLRQLYYVRGESRFSDHRPVYSIFLAEVVSLPRARARKSMSCTGSRIEVEELLPCSHVCRI